MPDSTPPAKKKPKALRLLRACTLGALVLGLLQTEPEVFHATVRTGVWLAAKSRGATVQMERLENTIFEPLLIQGISVEHTSSTGNKLQFRIARLEADFSWKKLLLGSFDRCFSRITVDGAQGSYVLADHPHETQLRAAADPASPLPRLPAWTLPLPQTLDVRRLGITVQNGKHSLEINQASFLLSALEPGAVSFRRIAIHQPWLDRTFRNVRGSTALQGSRLLLGKLSLEPELEVTSFSADLARLGGLDPEMQVQMQAFGGACRGQARIVPDSESLILDGSTTFTQIDLAKLALFFNLSDAAGGTIKEGKLNFRGGPQQPEKSTASLLLEATNFQWETRQWDSLSVGAELINSRLKVSRLELDQGPNRISLSGEASLPAEGVNWLQNEFTCDVSAELNDLTALSALLLPEFKYTAGKAKLEGSIRSRNQNFTGQLILSGSSLKWRNAPIENLHAALRLSGNDCHILNLEIFNGADYLRGRGVVNILGPSQYWGELRASIDEMATYDALIQKTPLLPSPLSGGAVMEWTGSGSTKGHEGNFLARLRRVKLSAKPTQELTPFNLETTGSYTGDALQLSSFTLTDDHNHLQADIALQSTGLSVKKIQLAQDGKTTLQGSALLPLSLPSAETPAASTSLFPPDKPGSLDLSANDLNLQAIGRLLGLRNPPSGHLSGTLQATGSATACKSDGSISITDAKIPLSETGPVLAIANITGSLQNGELQVQPLQAIHPFGTVQLGGHISLANILRPQLHLEATLPSATLPLFGSAKTSAADASLKLQIEGPADKAKVSGAVTSVQFQIKDDLRSLWQQKAKPSLPPLFGEVPDAWKLWELDLQCKTDRLDLHIGGSIAEPALEGTVNLSGLNASANGKSLTLQEASVRFFNANPSTPLISLIAIGEEKGTPFNAYVTGSLDQLRLWSTLPLDAGESFIPDLLGGPPSKDAAPQPKPDAASQKPAPPAVVP